MAQRTARVPGACISARLVVNNSINHRKEAILLSTLLCSDVFMSSVHFASIMAPVH